MKSFRFCHFLAVYVIATLASASAQTSVVFSNSAPSMAPRRTSIILIVANGLGYGDLSCYGQTKFQTPNLDKLAAGGVRFTGYSAEAGIPVSEAALMLGKAPAHLRQRADTVIPLAGDEITVAQWLHNAGYHTGWIGEWGLGDEKSNGAPWQKGFDEFAGYLDADDAKNFYADYMYRCAPKAIFDATNYQARDFLGKEQIYPNTDGKKEQYIPDLLAMAADNFVKNNHPDRYNHYQPLFLVAHFPVPGDGKSTIPSDAPFSDEPWPQPEKNKAALIWRLDGYVGHLHDELNKLGMTNDVAIFVTSDSVSKKNGGADPEFFHSNVSTNDLRVPMILFGPVPLPAGRVSDVNGSAKDFLPTAAEIGQVKAPPGIDGTSLLPAAAK